MCPPYLACSSSFLSSSLPPLRSVRYPEILDGFSPDYLYLDSIRFILSVKTCSFAEHSPMLNDITIIKTCKRTEGETEQGSKEMKEAEMCKRSAVLTVPLVPSPRVPFSACRGPSERRFVAHVPRRGPRQVRRRAAFHLFADDAEVAHQAAGGYDTRASQVHETRMQPMQCSVHTPTHDCLCTVTLCPAFVVEVVKVEDPCCSDSIHFPSSIGAKQTRAAPTL